MTNLEDNFKKLMGWPNENYAMWRFRLVTMLKRKRYWKDILKNDCSPKAQMKTTNTIVSVLGDVSFSVCMDHGDNPFRMIELLNARFASACTSSLYAVHSTLFGKSHNRKKDLAQYIDEFQ